MPNRLEEDAEGQRRLDEELFEALLAPDGSGWSKIESILERGANPNALRRHAQPGSAPFLVHKAIDPWTPRDESLGFSEGSWGSISPLGAVFDAGTALVEKARPVADDADAFAQMGFFTDARAREAMAALLRHGADPNAMFAMHHAASHPSYPQRVVYKMETRPLHAAVAYSFPECARMLLAHGADPAQLDEEGRPAVAKLYAEHRNASFTRAQLAIAGALVEAGSDIDCADRYFGALLPQAASILNLAMVEGLLALGAKPSQTESTTRQTPLHLMSCRPKRDEDTCADALDPASELYLIHRVAATLLAAGADPHARDNAGRDPRMMGDARVACAIDAYLAAKDRADIESALPAPFLAEARPSRL